MLQIAVLAWSAVLAFDGVLSIGQVTAFQALFLMLGTNVDYMMQYLPRMIRSTGGLRRIDSLLRAEPEVRDRAAAASESSFEHNVVVRRRDVLPRRSRADLDDVSFTIPKGSYVAFVGPSGCGKSTVLSLLMRMYDPEGGAVRVDGTDVRDVRQDVYRSLLAPVLQDSFLFDTSVRENIRMGRLDATDSEIEAAARAAEIDDAVRRLADGYDTTVGHRGQRLSGGERQRVAIARAIVRDPADPGAGRGDLGAGRGGRRRRSTRRSHGWPRTERWSASPIASHRSSDHDCIFVLHDGRVVEHGRHEELLDLDGVYAGLWSKQAGFRTQPGRRGAPRSPPSASRRSRCSRRWTTTCSPSSPASSRRSVGRSAASWCTRATRPTVSTSSCAAPSPPPGWPTTAQSVVSRVLEDGDYFGEVGLLHDVPRTATVRTAAPTVLLTLNRDTFRRMLERVPELRDALRRDYPELAAGGDHP